MKHLRLFENFNETVSSFNELDVKKLMKQFKIELNKFITEMEENPETVTSFDFVDIVIDMFKKEIGDDKNWNDMYTSIQDDNNLYDSDNFYDRVFDYVMDYLENNPLFFSKKLDDTNKNTGIFENLLSTKIEEIKQYLEYNKNDLSTFFSDLFPGKVMSQKKLNELGFYMLEEKEYVCEETTLPYNKIYFTQKFLHEKGLNPEKLGRPNVYYFNNRFILEDGHHRFVNQLLNGNTNIEVLLCKLKEQTNVFENERAEFLKWKRKNVTLRGIKEIGYENNGGALMGQGLYTAFLGNREMAKQYGIVRFVLNAIPKNPIILQSINGWEIYLQRLIIDVIGKYDVREFYKNHTIEGEIMKKGYDGVIIKGREMVNYKPENVLYFSNEKQLNKYWYDYYKTNI